jgi:hypothetical protein
MSKPLTEAALAAALSISVRHLRRLAQQGMPTASIAAARTWREQNTGVHADAGAPSDLVTARTKLVEEQTKRVRVIRRKVEADLLPAAEVRQLLVSLDTSQAAHLRTIERRFRAAHPNLPPEAHDFLRAEIDDAMKMMSADVLAMQDDGDEGRLPS